MLRIGVFLLFPRIYSRLGLIIGTFGAELSGNYHHFLRNNGRKRAILRLDLPISPKDVRNRRI